MKRILILGAAGRDFHNFNVLYRNNPDVKVVAFTATQIPDIADRTYPAELAGSFYPQGIPILDEAEMEHIIRDQKVDAAVFSYSDVSHVTLMHLASRVVAAGADFQLIGADKTMVESHLPVLSICAVRTGCGKSPVSRKVVAELRKLGWHPVVVRHPMPYGDLAQQAVQRFARLADLDWNDCTIEEREEYEPHIMAGTVVYAGVDYEAILRRAEHDGDMVIWDGGNNDTSFYKSDLEMVVLDPHRAGHELLYYPGEVNLRRAQVVVINKVNTAEPQALDVVRRNVANVVPGATVIEADCSVTVDDPALVEGKRVLVVEDGPTVTHGEMPYGAGVVAARAFHAREMVDPRPFAVGSIRKTFEKYPHLGAILPAMGYSDAQRHELETTINSTNCDVVVVATPVDLSKILKLDRPSVRVRYEIGSVAGATFEDVLQKFTAANRRAVIAGAGK